MLLNQTVEQLRRLRLSGMAAAFAQQLEQPELQALSFEERFSLLLDREIARREDRRLSRLLQLARLRQQACVARAQPDGLIDLRRLDPCTSQPAPHRTNGHW